MIRVGLTGNIGSGKSVVSDIFETLGVPVYRSDDKAKVILNSPAVINKLKSVFGEDIINIEGKPDRKKIAEIVFTDNEQLSVLNNIIHPAVMIDFEQWVELRKECKYVIMESAILYETGYSTLFDKIIITTAPESIKIRRVMERDKLQETDVRNRMKNQSEEKDKIKIADYIIENDERTLVIPQVLSIHQSLIM